MAGAATPGQLIAAVLLPPLGVFLARGLGSEFWVTTLLTLIGWLPGVIFALVILLKPALFDRTAAA